MELSPRTLGEIPRVYVSECKGFHLLGLLSVAGVNLTERIYRCSQLCECQDLLSSLPL